MRGRGEQTRLTIDEQNARPHWDSTKSYDEQDWPIWKDFFWPRPGEALLNRDGSVIAVRKIDPPRPLDTRY
jgi:hypothetical protein